MFAKRIMLCAVLAASLVTSQIRAMTLDQLPDCMLLRILKHEVLLQRNQLVGSIDAAAGIPKKLTIIQNALYCFDNFLNVNKRFRQFKKTWSFKELTCFLKQNIAMAIHASKLRLIGQNKLTGINEALFYIATSGKYAEIISLLVLAGGNVNAKDKNGATPLHCAGYEGFLDVVKALMIEKNIDVNVQDNDGFTPLHYAEMHKDVVQLLLNAGANQNIRTYGDKDDEEFSFGDGCTIL
jgi:hypothetical protein